MPPSLSRAHLPMSKGSSGTCRWVLPLLILGVACLIACGGSLSSPTPDALERGVAAMAITSPAFENGAPIPSQYSCEGDDVSPPIELGTPPHQTRSLALIMDDPDAPGGTFVHWIAFNFDADRLELDEGLGKEGEKIEEGVHGVNSFGKQAYGGPCPPSGRAHTYRVTVYALDRKLELEAGSTVTAVASAMRGNVLGLGQLQGTYSSKQ